MVEDAWVLIEQAERQLDEIQSAYAGSLESKSVAPSLRALIKNCVENQRSALEYVAHAVHDRHGTSGRSYFPIVGKPEEFLAQFDRQLRGVATSCPGVRDYVESLQPYHPGNHWLADLSELTNENKHRRLTPQIRHESRHLATGPGGGRIGRSQGAQIQMGPGASIVLGGDARIEFGGLGSLVYENIQETVYVDWLFADLGKPVLRTLQEIAQQLPSVVRGVCQVAGLDDGPL